jgi:hypothetical protein
MSQLNSAFVHILGDKENSVPLRPSIIAGKKERKPEIDHHDWLPHSYLNLNPAGAPSLGSALPLLWVPQPDQYSVLFTAEDRASPRESLSLPQRICAATSHKCKVLTGGNLLFQA